MAPVYGDGAITPAVSLLSALEGLKIVAPALDAWVLPTAVTMLVALFALQPMGTARIGHAFGPIMLIWFAAIAALGLRGVIQHPGVLLALNPRLSWSLISRRSANWPRCSQTDYKMAPPVE